MTRVRTEPADTTTRSLARLLLDAHLTLGGAESITAGRVAASLAAAPHASTWFRGCLVAYSTEVKHRVLRVPDGPVISETCAAAMAQGARRLLGCDVGYATTGVGGPDEVEGQPPGTVWIAVAGLGGTTARLHHLEGGPPDVVRAAADEATSLLLEVLLRGGLGRDLTA